MEFYIDEPEKEFEYLGTEENDLLSPFDDGVEIKHRSHSSYKLEDVESFSNDSIKFSVVNGKDIWNEKHAWAINHQETSNSNYHLEFIGGSPEYATMVNPNIVIPKDKFFYDVDDHKLSNIPKKSDSACQTDNINSTTNIKSSDELAINKSIKLPRLGRSDIEASIKTLLSCPFDINSNSSSTINCEDNLSKHLDEKELIVNDDPGIKHEVKKEVNDDKEQTDDYYQDTFLYPKPAFSYSCLISMALKNSKDGCLPVSEIYNFMCHHFPYFKTAPNGWKNSVRHNLSLNKCFEKIERPAGCVQRKGCLWALNPDRADKMNDELKKWTRKHREGIQKSMVYPDQLDLLERGELKIEYSVRNSYNELVDEEFEGESGLDLNDLNNLVWKHSVDNNGEEKELLVQDGNLVYTKCDELFVTTGSVVPTSIIVVSTVANDIANVRNEEFITGSSDNDGIISVVKYDEKAIPCKGSRKGSNNKKASKISLNNVSKVITDLIEEECGDINGSNDLIKEFIHVEHSSSMKKQRKPKQVFPFVNIKSSKGVKRSKKDKIRNVHVNNFLTVENLTNFVLSDVT